jgi:hypothetical protein
VEAALVAANVVLVAITGWYAWQTHQTVVEMRESRRAVVRPHVCLDLKTIGGSAIARVENVGTGPALNAKAAARLFNGTEVIEQLDWATPVLRPGESRLLWMPKAEPSFDYHRDHDGAITLTGTCASAAGETIQIDDRIPFTAEMQNELTVTSSADISERLKKITEVLQQIQKALPSRE